MTIFDESDVCTCIGCGCDDNHACYDENTENPCHWLREDRDLGLGVCSVCKHLVEAWDAGDREVRVPVEPDPSLDSESESSLNADSTNPDRCPHTIDMF